jgi:hypothetical protein
MGGAGMGGAGMSGAGMSGAGMSGAGMGGQGGSGTRSVGDCAFACANDDDCENFLLDFVCNTTSLRCEDPFIACDADGDCVPVTSGWTYSCIDDLDCLEDESCITVHGGGFCAINTALGPCEVGTVPVFWPRFGATGTAEVCEDRSGRCDRGTCRDNCVQTGCVSSSRGKACDATTGLCGCTTPTNCAGIAGVSTCNATTKLCECVTDADCDAVLGRDICVNGRCGCSATSVCDEVNNPHESADPVCDPRG